MPTSYRVEISPNNRAGCSQTECKKNKVKITKGQVRFGSLMTIMEHTSWGWKHWGCVTPKIIQNVNNHIDGDFDLLEGLDELSQEWQDKIKKALEDGHIPDEDCTGDLAEYNRLGQKKPRAKKAKNDEDIAGEPVPEPSSKSAPPKRGRKARGADEEVEQEVSAEKKTRKGKKAKGPATTENGDENIGSAAQEAPVKARKSKKAEPRMPDNEAAEEIPMRAKRPKKSKTEAELPKSNDNEEAESIPVKVRKSRKTKKAEPEPPKSDDEEVADEPPSKTKRSKKPKKAVLPKSDDEAAAGEEAPAPKAKRARKNKAPPVEIEEEVDVAPKPKRARKSKDVAEEATSAPPKSRRSKK